jgi:hypothetical protein
VFTTIIENACNLTMFPDNSFDLAHSNSVIEHVGSWENMESFAKETRRLAPSYFLQTPYLWFPMEMHFLFPFFQVLPEAWRAKLALTLNLGSEPRSTDMGAAMRRIRGVQLLDRLQLRYLFPDARIYFEWFGPFPKSLIAIRRGSESQAPEGAP